MRSARRNQHKHRTAAIELAVLRCRTFAFIPMQGPGCPRQNDDGFTPAQVVMISAHGSPSSGGEVHISNVIDEVERFGWHGKAEAARVAGIGEFQYLNFHGYLLAIMEGIGTLREGGFIDICAENGQEG